MRRPVTRAPSAAWLSEHLDPLRKRLDAVGVAVKSECNVSSWRFDPEHLGRALDNLLDNALAYANPGSAICVTIVQETDRLRLHRGHAARRLRPPDEARLITGESGAGKELVARAVHSYGPRTSKAFIAVNCAAIPGTLLESELFGHEKGAFTGATERRKGLFQVAEGGTLFLDEIGDMELSLQPKVLRVVDERVVLPVGATRPLPSWWSGQRMSGQRE